MFRKSNGTDPFAARLDFNLRDITGRWVNQDGMPAVTVYRNTSRKGGGIRLCLTYNNPQAVFDCTIYSVFGLRYIDLYGRVGLAYDRERDVLLLSAYGEYVRAQE